MDIFDSQHLQKWSIFGGAMITYSLHTFEEMKKKHAYHFAHV